MKRNDSYAIVVQMEVGIFVVQCSPLIIYCDRGNLMVVTFDNNKYLKWE